MWPTNYWPARYWSLNHWPVLSGRVTQSNVPINNRLFVDRFWTVSLINSDGDEYELGTVAMGADTLSIEIPGTVPNGTYEVKVVATGLAWEGLIQKSPGTIKIDREASVQVESVITEIRNLRYTIEYGRLVLRWDSVVSVADSGLVSAGIWLTEGVPDFEVDTSTHIVPLFSFQTENTFRLSGEDVANYAGVAVIGENDVIMGDGSYIALPARATGTPTTVVEEG